MNRDKLLELSNLGTIEGIKKLLETLGENYIFPRVSFYALEDGMFSPEDSHFVMNNCEINVEDKKISFVNEKREQNIEFDNSKDIKFFYGNRLGERVFGEENFYFIEFSSEEYFIEVRFKI